VDGTWWKEENIKIKNKNYLKNNKISPFHTLHSSKSRKNSNKKKQQRSGSASAALTLITPSPLPLSPL